MARIVAPPTRVLPLVAALCFVPGALPLAGAPTGSPGSAATPAPAVAPAVTPIRYEISFEGRDHREARIRMHLADVGPGPVALRMSRTSPGRYALHEFAKNVYDVRITDVAGTPLPVERPDPHQWTVSGHGGEFFVEYTLYADRGDGTYAQVDRSHAHLNVPATFLYARDHLERPVEVRVRVPEGSGWVVASQLEATDDPEVFRAPNGHYFMDSPLEIAALEFREWTVQTEHGPQTIQIAMHHQGTDAELDLYAEHTRAITEELAAIFGEWPDFDFHRYTFLACYVPWASGDGMEHRNSTVLTSSGSLATSMTGLLGTVAHEFVHAWSIERLRPASLEPFDWEAANMSPDLWFGEGFTSYLDDLALVRGGVIDEAEFIRRMGGIATTITQAPGRRFFSPIEMSLQAPFVDAATSVDPTNRGNTFLSYYTWGSGIALALDLDLRTRFDRTLDHLMQEMWQEHGRVERPYVESDIERALATVTGDAEYAAAFFDAYIRGSEAPDFASLFAGVGVEWALRSDAPLHLTRASLRFEGGGAVVASNTTAGDPLYRAGVDRGDRILQVDGTTVASASDLARLLERRTEGDRVPVVIEGRGEVRTVEVELTRRPVRDTQLRADAAADIRARRAAWIAPQAGVRR